MLQFLGVFSNFLFDTTEHLCACLPSLSEELSIVQDVRPEIFLTEGQSGAVRPGPRPPVVGGAGRDREGPPGH